MDPHKISSSTLTPKRWRQVQDVMLACLEAPDRPQFLAEACGDDQQLRREVEQLLRSHDQAEEDWLEAQPRIDNLDEGTEIGNYRLAERLGTGGMGEVFSAFRSDDAYRRRVAIKVLRPGFFHPGMTSRFRTERQILANINHPHIALLLDGGETPAGQPYLVMELVEGRPIDSYCDRRQLAIRDRLELFCKVCDAVEVAHQNLVVHRDLKPSNILVGETGEPKLLDFGIAKILEPAAFPQPVDVTETGLAPMTPRYAAPEQINAGSITTATDVYSLGVLLYELLTGLRPYQFQTGNLTSMIQAICHDDPRRPSSALLKLRRSSSNEPQPTRQHPSSSSPESVGPVDPVELGRLRGVGPRELHRQLVGDLDAIVLKALRKSPEERYRSVAQLTDDIRRHLDNRPVTAHRGSIGYTARKFARRHRWGVGALSLFIAMMTYFNSMLWLERQQTAAQRDRFEATSGFLTELFSIPNPTRSQGRSITVRELLDRGVEAVDDRFTDQPEVKADLLGVFGESFAGLGLYPEAAELFESSLSLYSDLGLDKGGEAARRRRQWADTLAGLGDYDRATRQAEMALEHQRGVFGEEHPEVVASLVTLANIRRFQGDYASSASILRRAAASARRLDVAETTAEVLGHLSLAEDKLGNLQAAEENAQEAVALLTSHHGVMHPRTALMMANLADIIQQHDPQTAEQLLRRAWSLQQKLFDQPHPDMVLTLQHLGNLLTGAPPGHDVAGEAESLLTEAVALNRRLYGDQHPLIAISLQGLAQLKARQGDRAAAEQLYDQALTMLRAELGEDHMELARCQNNYGQLLFDWGDSERAQELISSALNGARQALGEEHPEVAAMLSNAASLAGKAGDHRRAVELRRPAIDIVRDRLGRNHPTLGIMLYNQALAHGKLGQTAEAAQLIQEALPIRRADLGHHHPTVGRMLVRLALLQIDLENWEAAERRARQGKEILRQHLPEQGSWHRAAQRGLGTSLLRQGRLDEAEGQLTAHLQALEADRNPDLKRLRRAVDLLLELHRLQGNDRRVLELEQRRQKLDL